MSDSIYDLLASPATDAGSRIVGVAVGIVTNNRDPDRLGRVRVRFPWLGDSAESAWARVASPMAGNGRGLYFLPEVDDEVLVAFQHGRPEAPVVLGGMWNGKDKPPAENGDGENNLRVIKSRSGHLIRFNDSAGESKIEIIDQSGKNKIVVDSAANTVTISCDADMTIRSAEGKIAISGASVEIKATSGGIELSAGTTMTVKAATDLTLKGMTVNIN